jgi:hypothetical protein
MLVGKAHFFPDSAPLLEVLLVPLFQLVDPFVRYTLFHTRHDTNCAIVGVDVVWS